MDTKWALNISFLPSLSNDGYTMEMTFNLMVSSDLMLFQLSKFTQSLGPFSFTSWVQSIFFYCKKRWNNVSHNNESWTKMLNSNDRQLLLLLSKYEGKKLEAIIWYKGLSRETLLWIFPYKFIKGNAIFSILCFYL